MFCDSIAQDVMKKFPSVLTEQLDDLVYALHGIDDIDDGMTFKSTSRAVKEEDRELAKEAADRVFTGGGDTCTFEHMKQFLVGDELFQPLRDRYGKKHFREAMARVLVRLTQLGSRSSTVVTRAAFEHWFATGWVSMQEAMRQYVHVSNAMVKNMSVDDILAMTQTMEADGAADPDPEMLLEAVNDGDLATAINLIVKNGTDVDSTAEDGYTALMRGSAFGEVQCVEALIKLKADVNHVAEDGTTALIIAAFQNDSDVTRALCQFGKEDLNIAQPMLGNNANALYLAAQEGHVGILKEILATPGGVAPEVLNAQVKGGISATYIAAYEGHAEILEALVKAKSDMNLRSDQGATPLFVALQNHHYTVLIIMDFHCFCCVCCSGF